MDLFRGKGRGLRPWKALSGHGSPSSEGEEQGVGYSVCMTGRVRTQQKSCRDLGWLAGGGGDEDAEASV